MDEDSCSQPASSTGHATLDAVAAIFDLIAPWRLMLRRLMFHWHDGRVPPSMRTVSLKEPDAHGADGPISFEDIDAFDAKFTGECERLLEDILVQDPEFGERLESRMEELLTRPIQDLALVGVVDRILGLEEPKTLLAFISDLLSIWNHERYERGHWFWFLQAGVTRLDPSYSPAAKVIENMIAARRADASRQPKDGIDDTSATRGVASSESLQSSATPTARLSRMGETWETAFRDEAPFHVKDRVGLHYIAVLLRSPGIAIPALDLEAAGKRAAAFVNHVSLAASSAAISAQEVVDDSYVNEIQAELQVIRQKILTAEEDGKGAEAVELKDRKEVLEKLLRSDMGRGGKPRRFSDEQEKGRQRVTRAIQDAIDAISEYNKETGDHLRRAIRCGARVKYEPVDEIIWRVSI